jgi:hypothetical protein
VHEFPDTPIGLVDVGPRQARQLLGAQTQADGQRQRRLGARRVPAPRPRDAEDVPDLRGGGIEFIFKGNMGIGIRASRAAATAAKGQAKKRSQ